MRYAHLKEIIESLDKKIDRVLEVQSLLRMDLSLLEIDWVVYKSINNLYALSSNGRDFHSAANSIALMANEAKEKINKSRNEEEPDLTIRNIVCEFRSNVQNIVLGFAGGG